MSISNLFSSNNYDLFSRSHTVEELIASKLSNRLGGSFGLYDPALSYDEGDIVIYNGCIYKSLVDNNTVLPSPEAPEWIKISMLKNEHILICNAEIGDDTKALLDCSPYPFKTIDAALTFAETNFLDTETYIILLQHSNNAEHTISKNITHGNITMLSIEDPALDSTFRGGEKITCADTITISCKTAHFKNLFFYLDDSAGAKSILSCQTYATFVDCLFGKEITQTSTGGILATNRSDLDYERTLVNIHNCRGAGGSGNYIIIKEQPGLPFEFGCNVRLIDCKDGASSFLVNDISGPPLDPLTSKVAIEFFNCEYQFVVKSDYGNIKGFYTTFGNVNYAANSPGAIRLYYCSFFIGAPTDDYGVFNKTGTANFYIVSSDLPPSYTLADGTDFSILKTAGPQYNYVATTKYKQNDIVILNGCIYKSLVDNNTTTPSFNSPDWIKISMLKNEHVLVCNADNGDDSKALLDCSPYPFKTIDAALTYAETNFLDTETYIILLQHSIATNYTLSKNITHGYITMLSIEEPEDDEAYFGGEKIICSNTITISCKSANFKGLSFYLDDSLSATNIFVCGTDITFKDCLFEKVNLDNTTGCIYATNGLRNGRTLVNLYNCGYVETASSYIIIKEQLGLPFEYPCSVRLHDCKSVRSSFIIRDTSSAPLNPLEIQAEIEFYNCENQSVGSSTFSNITAYYTTFGNFFNSSDSPAYIKLYYCSFYKPTLEYGQLNKNGTANFYIVSSDLPPSYTLADGTDFSILKTAGPQYNYVATTEYNDTDITFNAGEIYRCRLNGTKNITPIASSPNWYSLTELLQYAVFAQNTLTPAPLSTGLTTTADKLNIPALINDGFNILTTTTTNTFTFANAGVYEILGNIEIDTTQTSGQNGIIDIFVGLSSNSNVANSLARSTVIRGLVGNSGTYPVNNVGINLFLTLPPADPNIGVALSLYARNTNNQSFNARLVKFYLLRIRTY